MDMPRLDYQGLSVLSRLSRRPAKAGQIDHGLLLHLIELGLVIRYKTIFLITPLGVALLQRQPFRRFVSRFAGIGRALFGQRQVAPSPRPGQNGPELVWRA